MFVEKQTPNSSMNFLKQYHSVSDCSKKFIVKRFNDLVLVTNQRDYPNPENDPVRAELRGLILSVNDKDEFERVVCYGLDHIEEIKSLTDLEYLTFDDSYEYSIEESIDGTLIRMFYYDGAWNYATNRCIDASKSYWQSEHSFKELFLEAAHRCQLDTSKMNTSCTYSFVLCHPENRNVKKYNKPTIYHIGTRNNSSLHEIEHDIGIHTPKQIVLYNEPGTQLPYVIFDEANKLPFFQEGYILKIYMNDQIYRIKIVNKAYTAIHSIKGNCMDPAKRYIEIRIMGQEAIDRYLKYFPEHTTIFAETEMKIKELAKYLHDTYIQFFIERNRTKIDPVYYKAISALHEIHKATKEKTTKDSILEFLGTLEFEGALTLYELI